jgi:hypothetical protein
VFSASRFHANARKGYYIVVLCVADAAAGRVHVRAAVGAAGPVAELRDLCHDAAGCGSRLRHRLRHPAGEERLPYQPQRRCLPAGALPGTAPALRRPHSGATNKSFVLLSLIVKAPQILCNCAFQALLDPTLQ